MTAPGIPVPGITTVDIRVLGIRVLDQTASGMTAPGMTVPDTTAPAIPDAGGLVTAGWSTATCSAWARRAAIQWPVILVIRWAAARGMPGLGTAAQ